MVMTNMEATCSLIFREEPMIKRMQNILVLLAKAVEQGKSYLMKLLLCNIEKVAWTSFARSEAVIYGLDHKHGWLLHDLMKGDYIINV